MGFSGKYEIQRNLSLDNCVEFTEHNSEQIYYFEILNFEKFRDLNNNLCVHKKWVIRVNMRFREICHYTIVLSSTRTTQNKFFILKFWFLKKISIFFQCFFFEFGSFFQNKIYGTNFCLLWAVWHNFCLGILKNGGADFFWKIYFFSKTIGVMKLGFAAQISTYCELPRTILLF